MSCSSPASVALSGRKLEQCFASTPHSAASRVLDAQVRCISDVSKGERVTNVERTA